jgi:hypothetical protein
MTVKREGLALVSRKDVQVGLENAELNVLFVPYPNIFIISDGL